MSFENVIYAWRQAADDLQIEIESPFIATTPNNATIKFDLLVKYFGNKLGTIILLIDNTTKSNDIAQSGYYCSAINPETYSVYDRQHFIDTLNDWGYFGDPSKKPNWYTGQPWTK